MAKDAQVRLEETLAFLDAAKLPKNAKYVKDVKSPLKTFIAKQSEMKHQGKTMDVLMSEWMSQKQAAERPAEKEQRDYRRAIMLVRFWLATLEEGLPKKEIADDVNKIAHGKLAAELDEAIGEGWDLLTRSLPGSLNPKWDQLVKDPDKFLKENKLWVSGIKEGKETQYKMFYRTGMYWLDCTGQQKPSEYVTKKAFNIPVTAWSTVKDKADEIVGTNVTSGEIALTTQFTGCCYCFMVSEDRKKLAAAHIDPERKVPGEKMAEELRQWGYFQINGPKGLPWMGKFRAYGRVKDPKKDYGYGDGRIIIVAVKGSGGWEIWSQTQTPDDKLVVAQVFDPKWKDD